MWLSRGDVDHLVDADRSRPSARELSVSTVAVGHLVVDAEEQLLARDFGGGDGSVRSVS